MSFYDAYLNAQQMRLPFPGTPAAAPPLPPFGGAPVGYPNPRYVGIPQGKPQGPMRLPAGSPGGRAMVPSSGNLPARPGALVPGGGGGAIGCPNKIPIPKLPAMAGKLARGVTGAAGLGATMMMTPAELGDGTLEAYYAANPDQAAKDGWTSQYASPEKGVINDSNRITIPITGNQPTTGPLPAPGSPEELQMWEALRQGEGPSTPAANRKAKASEIMMRGRDPLPLSTIPDMPDAAGAPVMPNAPVGVPPAVQAQAAAQARAGGGAPYNYAGPPLSALGLQGPNDNNLVQDPVADGRSLWQKYMDTQASRTVPRNSPDFIRER